MRPLQPRLRPGVAATLAVVIATSCGAPPPPGSSRPAEKPATPAALASAVAVVEGEPITAAEIKTQAEAAGTDARTALAALVEEKLLSREAARRGYDRDPEVREAIEREMVRRLLRTGFEKEVTPGGITDDQLRRAYEKNADKFDRPELYKVLHILAPIGPTASPEERDLAKRRAEEVALRAKSARTPEEFKALPDQLSDARLKLKGEEVVTGRQGWTLRPFADATFALAKVGDVSGVVETRFGFHVIYLEEKLPEVHVPLADVREVLRQGVWPAAQRQAFARLVDELVDKHHIEKYEDRLGEEPGVLPEALPEAPAAEAQP